MSNNIPDNVCIAFFVQDGPYHYSPSLGAGIAFTITFAASTIHHFVVSYRARRWWQLVFAVGATSETLGWAARIWSYKCPYQLNPFLIQTCTLIIAPAFFTAGIYIILGRLIRSFGPGFSPFTPSTYLYIFCTIDFISLILQAVGGGLASSALTAIPPTDPSIGNHTMLSGIVFQLASTIVFSALFISVIFRATRAKLPQLQERKVKAIIAGTAFSVTLVVVRGIYRTIELNQGWNGYLMSRERYVIGLDASMMILAVAVFNFVSPGWANVNKKTRPNVEKSGSHSSVEQTLQV